MLGASIVLEAAGYDSGRENKLHMKSSRVEQWAIGAGKPDIWDRSALSQGIQSARLRRPALTASSDTSGAFWCGARWQTVPAEECQLVGTGCFSKKWKAKWIGYERDPNLSTCGNQVRSGLQIPDTDAQRQQIRLP